MPRANEEILMAALASLIFDCTSLGGEDDG